jgi:predicted Zn-dependent protease
VTRWGALVLAVAGCATTHVEPRTRPDVGITDQDEKGLWQLAAETQERIERSGHLVGDPELDAYLLDLARGLEPPEVFAALPFRFRVIRDRTPNAFCLPNGAIYVNTGLLVVLENEAELAAILGHEMTHAVNRHALRSLRSSENSGAWLNALSSPIGGPARPGGLLFMASVAGYSRDLEREADREGVARMASAGYEPGEAPRALERLKEWVEAEKIPPGQSFYSSHPKLEERIESLRAIAPNGAAGSGRRESDRFSRHVAPVLLDAARADLAAGRAASARREAERFLAIRPDAAGGHYVLAELARRGGEPGALDAALASYRRAVELDPGTAEAWRGMGLLLERRGERGAAREALERYLRLAPDAPDRGHIRAMIDRAGGGLP